MTQVIIYNQDNGIPAVLMHTEEVLQNHTIQKIAIKNVPASEAGTNALIEAQRNPFQALCKACA